MPDKALVQSIIRLIDTVSADGKYDTLINVLSLLCIITILNKQQAPAAAQQQALASPSASPIQKLLGELTKNDGGSAGGPSLDTIMSLLPLLNSPQLKSKLNPSSMSTILGLINSLGGSGDKADAGKTDKPDKTDKSEGKEKGEVKAESKKEAPAAAATEASALPPAKPEVEDEAKKTAGRYLNWKTNF